MRTFFLVLIGVLFGATVAYSAGRILDIQSVINQAGEYVPNVLKQNTPTFDVSKDFLESEIFRLKENRETFVLAKLTTSEMEVYENGVQVLSVPIQAKGREGSWWETPAGVYTIKIKSKDHFSSIGKVYMPWSMQFQGNFFIHGLPYYPDGSLVSTSYSGGCIRLNTEDSKKVYDLVKSGTKVIVYEDTKKTSDSNSAYSFGPSSITAGKFLVADLSDGFTFASKGQGEEIVTGETSKLLLAIVAAEYMDIEKKIIVDSTDLVKTKKPRLEPGNTSSIYDFLYLVLQESSNEAVHVLARAMGYSRSIDLINAKAKAIGMEKTNFENLEQESKENITTLSDAYQLLRYMNFNRKFLLSISANNAETHIYGKPDFSNIENFNLFSGDASFVGGVVGQSENGASGFFVFEVPFGEITKPVGISIVESKDLKSDVSAIQLFLKTSFKK